MIEHLRLAAVFIAGMGLGTLFFGGLWWTTRRGLSAANPALWFSGSLLLRTSSFVGGLYFLAGGDWRRALAALLGFLLARLAILCGHDQPLLRSILLVEVSDESEF